MQDRNKDQVARELVAWHFEAAPELVEIYRLLDDDEGRNDEPIKLLEVNPDSVETGQVDAFFFAPDADIQYSSVVAEVTPRELQKILCGALDLPEGWNLNRSTRFRREDFSNGNGARPEPHS